MEGGGAVGMEFKAGVKDKCVIVSELTGGSPRGQLDSHRSFPPPLS